MNEVRSRLVSKVTDALQEDVSQNGNWMSDHLAEVAVRTVCDLIADEIDLYARRDPVFLGDQNYQRRVGAREIESLVRSLGQP